jgi:hypothetical protein
MDEIETDAGRRPWEGLPREGPYPAGLEERTVSRIRSEGAFEDRSPALAKWAAAAVLAVAIFAAGWLSGRGRPKRSPAPTFALLLYEGRDFERGDAAQRVAEYRRWVAALRRSGTAVTGEELSPIAREIPSAGAPVGEFRLSGFFLIGAPDLGSAEAIARSCPHLLHRGRIVVRPVVPT